MRIAIVTHKLLHNYGGALQAYALQKTLKDMGHVPIGIDCMPYQIGRTRYLLSNLKTLCYRLIGKTGRNWYRFPIEKRNTFFEDFYNSHLTLTPICRKYRYGILKRIEAEAVIVGSDQVWRSSFHPDRNLYMDMFLKFALRFNGLKIAYAASFGTDCLEIPKREEMYLCRLASKFNAISTREESGVKLCKRHLKVDALHICDPTILLERSDYISLTEHTEIMDYMFAYILDIEPMIVNTVEKIAKELGNPILVESAESSANISVEKWLGLIEDATAMITNSFHGLVFAIMSHTPFVVIAHKERGEERLYSLLNSLGLSERIVDNVAHIKSCMLRETDIDWENIDRKFGKMRIAGKRFLQEALLGKNTEEINQILLREALIEPYK